MFKLIPKEMSPVTVGFNSMRAISIFTHKWRPWSILLFAFNIIIVISIFYFSVLKLLLVPGSIQEISQGASAVAVTIHMGCKTVNAYIHQIEIEKLLQKLEEMRYEILNDPETKFIVIKSDLFINKLFTIIVTMSALFPVLTIFMNILADYITQSEKPHLSLPMYVPWSMKEFWPYLAGSAWIWLHVIMGALIYTAFPILNISFHSQISTFLRVLQARLEKHGSNTKNLHDYARINIMIQQFNEMFSGQFYLELCLTCLQQCGFSFSSIKALKTSDPAAVDLIYKIVITFIAPGLICACGQEISTQMEQLHYSAYRSNWYERSPKDRASLALLMTSTVNPVTVHYRRLAYFNFVLLFSVLQGAFSYITFLCNVEENN